ncbi:MAG TPA: GrpB family protein [Solirubrobacteraceae bacterium]
MASRPDQPIEIVAYDREWPSRFESERGALEAAIGECAVGGIHHVGSTAIPGLASKPTIDILVGVQSLAASRMCFDSLTALGYQYAPHLADEMHWFCKPNPLLRTHHLHLVPVGSRRYRDELAFRDHLRAHGDVAAEYAALKRGLAGRLEHDREAYTKAKTDFIRTVIEEMAAIDAPNTGDRRGPEPDAITS